MAATTSTNNLFNGQQGLMQMNFTMPTNIKNWGSSFNPKKVARYSSLKRGKEEVPLGERVKLERILGHTVSSNAALDCEPNTGLIVYPAGCVVIIYNPRKNKQTHILNASRKTITALAISLDGRHVVTGECGHQPHVRVWDIHERVQVAEFSGHKFGINCVAFSPNLKYVVSVGSQHDMIVNVWDWRNNIKVASNKVSSKVKAVSFSEDGGHFVTVGNRHVKFWYLEYCRSTKYKEPVPLMGRSAILGEQRNNYFCDVACGRGDVADSTFAITKSGLLCEFNSRRLLDKWVELRANANCLSVGLEYVFIGCSDGIVRCFSPYTLEYVTTLPRTHFLGADIAKSLTIAHMGSHPASAKYPDTVAITLDEVNRKVTCIYSDHSMYVWDIKDIRKVGKSHSFLYHSATIWGVEMYPEDSPEYLPPGSFVTCSSDDTIRIWNLDTNTTLTSQFKRNVYSSEILKLLYIDESLAHICENDRTLTNNDKGETSFDGRNGVRCIQIAPDGLHLASGDRSGNIRIYDLQYMQLVLKIEAHDAEVLCLEYSKPEPNRRYLASASRDRLIHIFDVNQGYSFIQTLDDHSSSITAVRFVQQFDNFQLISCGADRSIIFRSAQFTPNLQFTRSHHIVVKTTPYDMDIDSNSKQIFTACQDRNVRVYNINNGKHSRTFKGSQSDDGTLIKVVLDNSRLYVATSSTDKNLSIYDYYSGDCVATMFGHSEVVTGLRFTNDGKQLISVSGDGCIFVWRLPPEMTHSIQVHKSQMKNMGKAKRGIVSARRSVFESPRPLNPAREFNFDEHNGNDDEDDLSYRFSVGPLPLWAKKQMAEDPASNDVGKGSNISQPKGRWAQRIDPLGINVKTVYTSGEIISFPRHEDNESQQNDFYDLERFDYDESESSAEFRHSPEIFSRARTENMRSLSPSGMVTKNRGSSEVTPFRMHHPTELSSLTIDDFDLEQEAIGADDETESTELDLQEVIYYPPLDDDSHSINGDFKVCNTNPDDLREAHRRSRKLRAERPTDIPIIQMTGTVRSTDSEEDEEATTPLSIDQNVLSMFSMSTESLDRVGQREKFMKSNFENLEGSLQDGENNDNRSSFTARFLSKSQQPIRKTSTSKKTGREVPPSPKRLETMKRMEETRKKLDTIGWKASLNNSKSISDLTRILPEKDNCRSSAANKGMALLKTAATNSMPDLSGTVTTGTVLNRHDDHDNPSSFCTNSLPRCTEKRNVPLSGAGKRPTSPCRKNVMSNVKERTLKQPLAKKVSINQVLPSKCESDVSETIRRASSMTDLSPSKSFRRLLPPRPNVPNRTPAFGGPLRRNSAFVDPSKVSRCSSMTTLVGVGDEDSRILRPTISSKNKMKSNDHGLPKSASSSSLALRKNVENADSGTSSGDISPVDGAMEPPSLRARSTSVDRGRARSSSRLSNARSGNEKAPLSAGKWKSERDLSKMTFSLPNSSATKTSKHEVQLKKPTTTTAVISRKAIITPSKAPATDEDVDLDDTLKKSPQELPVKDDRAPRDILKLPLTHELCESTAGELKLVSDNTLQLFKRISLDNDLSESERQLMLNTLSQAANQAQDTLRSIRPTPSSEHPDLVQGMKTIPPELPGGGEAMSSLLQQYSDMLLNIVQQGMNSQSQTGSS